MFEKIKNDIESCSSLRKRNSFAIKKNRDFISMKMEEGFSASDIYREIVIQLGYEPCHIKNFISLVKKYVIDRKSIPQHKKEIKRDNIASGSQCGEVLKKNVGNLYLENGIDDKWGFLFKEYPFMENQLISAIKNGINYSEVCDLIERGKTKALFDLISEYSVNSKVFNRFIE